MLRFLNSRTGILLLGAAVLTLVIGIGWKERTTLPFLAQTVPPAVCGNNRCEIGEKGTVRIANPSKGNTNYGEMHYINFGRSVAYGGDDNNDGIPDLWIGARITDTPSNNGGTRFIARLNADGSLKEMVGGGIFGGYPSDTTDAYGSAFAYVQGGTYAYNYPVQYYDYNNPYCGTTGAAVKIGDASNSACISPGTASSIVNIGDINGDGRPEIALGYPGVQTSYGNGAVKIVSSTNWSTNSQSIQLQTHTIPSEGDGFPLLDQDTTTGLASFGGAVAALGDLDGDGKKEIAVNSMNLQGQVGVWVLSLNSDGTVASKSAIVPGTSFSLDSDSGWASVVGTMLAGIGDWDGDGIGDLAVSVSSAGFNGNTPVPIWILFLNRDKTVKSMRVIHNTDLGEVSQWTPGMMQMFSALGSLPDMDDDGKQELVIGSTNSNACTGNSLVLANQGAVHIFFSKALDTCPKDCNWCGPANATITADPNQAPSPLYSLPTCNNGSCNVGELNPMAIPTPYQINPYITPILNSARVALGDLSDLDGDGVPDIVMAGPTQNGNLDHTGEVAVVSLRSNGALKSMTRIFEGTGGLVTGRESAKHFGMAVAVLGDVDGDGVKDIAVNASVPDPQSPGQASQRSVYILFLKRDGTVKSWKEITQQDAGMTYSTHRFGVSLVGLGDFNGDGIPDLAVGTSSTDFYSQMSMPQDQLKGGRVHLLFLNRDGSIKSSKMITATAFYGNSATSKKEFLSFGTTMASFGDLFGDGRRLLIVNRVIIFLNANGSVNSSRWIGQNYSAFDTHQFAKPLSLANAGDMNRDGRSDLALAAGDLQNYYEQGITDAFFYSISSTGDLIRLNLSNTSITSYSIKPDLQEWAMIPAPFLITIPDLDGDGVREPVFTNNQSGVCQTPYGNAGTIQLAFTGEAQNICPNDCNSVNICSSSYGAGSSSSSSAASSVVSSAASSAAVSSSHSSSSLSTASASSAVSSHQSVSSSGTASSAVSSLVQSASSAGASSASASSSPTTGSSSASSVPVASSVNSQASIAVSSFSSSSVSFTASSTATQISSAYSSAAAQYSSATNNNAPAPSSPRCGNSILETEEACESGIPCANGGFCTAQCQCQTTQQSSRAAVVASGSTRCGDGILGGSEQCDSGIPCADGGLCTASCMCQPRNAMTPLCGNGVLNTREECDDGNAVDGDGCDARCRREVALLAQECGNGFLDGNEQCETTSPCPDSAFICSRCTCLAPVCGDGTRNTNEECDDRNTVDGDGCSAGCRKETPGLIAAQTLCGNGIVEEGEQCDDGNQLDRDGCSAACTVEHLAPTPATPDVSGLSLITDRPPEVAVISSAPSLIPAPVPSGPTPKKAPSLPSSSLSTGVRPQMRPAAMEPQVPLPAPAYYPVAATVTQQMAPQYPAYWQPYGSVVPYAPASGPVGKTGPASLAIMVSGAAAGLSFMRLKKRH